MGRGDRALEVFHAMRRQGIEPNRITYNALISTCEKGAQLEQSVAALQALQR